ncbi:hypothetical protein D9M69_553380 [compost metagenome]
MPTRTVAREACDCVRVVSGATGTGFTSSSVSRASCQPGPGAARSAMWASKAAGAPPCCARGSQGPRESASGSHASPSPV